MARLHPTLVAHLNAVAHQAHTAARTSRPTGLRPGQTATVPVINGTATKPPGVSFVRVVNQMQFFDAKIDFDKANLHLPDGVYYTQTRMAPGTWLQLTRRGGSSTPTMVSA